MQRAPESTDMVELTSGIFGHLIVLSLIHYLSTVQNQPGDKGIILHFHYQDLNENKKENAHLCASFVVAL